VILVSFPICNEDYQLKIIKHAKREDQTPESRPACKLNYDMGFEISSWKLKAFINRLMAVMEKASMVTQ
jgi:hypothetical protein